MAEPLEHTHKGVRYTCVGEGLLKDGYPYDAHAEKFLPPRGNAGSQNVEKKPVAWWKAQCAFRGLNQTGALGDLQLRLREAKTTMLPQLKTVQTELNRDYKKKNKTSGTWKNMKTVEQKAKADPEKYLVEAFPPGATGRPANLDLVVIKLQDHPALADAAEKLGLERVSVDAPWTGGEKPSPDRWLIIGRHRDAVWNQMQEIQRQTLRSKQDVPKEKSQKSKAKPVNPTLLAESRDLKSTPRKKQTARISDSVGIQFGDCSPRPYLKSPGQPAPKQRTKQTALRSEPFGIGSRSIPAGRLSMLSFSSSGASFTNEAVVPKGVWDVFGLYKISCPNIEGEWPQQAEMSLNIILEERDGKCQMFAEFDFGIVEGLMRFEKPTPVPKSEFSSNKRKKEDVDGEGDIRMYDYPEYGTSSIISDESVYRDAVFNLSSKDAPTVRRPIWRYRWRGRDTSENMIQLGSDKAVETIRFEKGGKLSGIFNGGFTGRCEFTGARLKTSRPVHEGGPPSIDSSWQELSHRTYDYEASNRWR